MNKVSILLVGIGGYGQTYANAILDKKIKFDIEVVGIVDPKPENYKRIGEFENVNIYNSVKEFFKKNSAQLTVISSPIHYHKKQSIEALRNGSNVLCEKPICARIDDALEMIEASKKYKRFIALGFQWSFSNTMIDLKNDLIRGRYGKIMSMKSIVLWPRDIEYFKRNNWAGKIKNGENYIYDSVVNNATAHYLHNMLWLCGDEIEKSVEIEKMEYNIYKGNDIENFDTCFIKGNLITDTKILFIASHLAQNEHNPKFEYICEKGRIVYDTNKDKSVIGCLNNGEVINYSNPFDYSEDKFNISIEAVLKRVRIPCIASSGYAHLKCINDIQNGDLRIVNLNNTDKISIKLVNGNTYRYVKGIDEKLIHAYKEFLIPTI